eukprot:4051130-Prymnesium_polylepis.1
MVGASAFPTQRYLPAQRLCTAATLLNTLGGDATGRYPPFAPERMSSDGTLECGLIVDRAPGRMQG